MKILFQGDSITDCGRRSTTPEGPGSGYVAEAAKALDPATIEVINRGISGNRVVDLYARWKPDALHIRPDVISILIGVNDTWHEFLGGNGVEVARYAITYRLLLEWTKDVLPDVRLVLCEPFVLPCGVVGEGWRDEIDQRREIVATLASDFGATLVPFQTRFDSVVKTHEPRDLAEDGVHPTELGHRLMANWWLEATGLSGAELDSVRTE